MAIQIRRGTNTEWESNNSNIVVGEPAIATDAERFFVGTASGDYAEFANIDVIAPAYDTTTSYVVGDIINYHGKLYSCNAPCSGAFNASYWDEKSLAEILKDLENEIDYAQYEIGYADGKLITINNGASEIPVKDLTVDIEAVQSGSGDPSPTNIRPISGWDEVNVNVVGKNWIEPISKSGTTTGYYLEFSKNSFSFHVNEVHLREGVQYRFRTKISSTVSRFTVSVGAGSGAYSKDISMTNTSYVDGIYTIYFTPTATHLNMGDIFAFRAPRYTSSQTYTYNIEWAELSIASQNTDSEYSPYNGQIYTTDLDGVRYGGTLDVTTGVLTVTHVKEAYDGTENWYMGNTIAYTYAKSFNMKSGTGQSGACNIAPMKTALGGSYGLCLGNQNTAMYFVDAKNAWGFTDVASLKAFVANNNIEIMYPLATPQVVQLTPTQVRTVLGTNNLWNQMNTNNELAYRISNALN